MSAGRFAGVTVAAVAAGASQQRSRSFPDRATPGISTADEWSAGIERL